MKDRLVDIIINGEPAKSRSMTTRGFLTSIAVSLALCMTCMLTFSILRRRLRSVYEPRTFFVAKHMRTPPSSSGLFAWLSATLFAPTSAILESSGLDAYFFLRYISFVMSLCAVLGIPLIVILLPIHISGNREGVHGLDRLSTTNLSESQTVRHTAHLVICIAFTFSSLLIFKFELIRYFRMRAAHIVGQKDNAPGPSSTILIKGLSQSYQSEQDIARFFSGLASTDTKAVVKRVWFNRSYSELHALVQQRKRVVKKLELLELWLIERCLGKGDPDGTTRVNGNKDATIVGNLWREYLCDADLKQMNGKRGSQLSWLKSEMCRLNSQIYQIQIRENSMPRVNSCFVQFDSTLSAFIASRSLGSENSIGIGSEIFDRVHPADVIWSNLDTLSWPAWLISIGATMLNYIFVFGWAIPVTLISMMAQVDTVAEAMPRIHWLLQAPKVSILMSNVLSPLIVSGLTSQVPMIFRCLARLKGYPTNTRVEMDVQKYLFLFMFFQLFLIMTLSTGLPSLMVQVLVNTSEGAITLASSLSKASTFFISYMTANSLTTAGNTLLQCQQLFIVAWHSQRGKTPRQHLKNKCRHSTIYWGSVFPLVTTIGSIAIAYALISPAIMISALIGLAALYVAFKYRVLYCYVPRCVADGDYYPKAIFQLFSGFYCQQVSLLGMLLLSRQLTLAMVVALVIIITMISQHHLNHLFLDLSTRIPLKPEFADTEGQMVGQKETKSIEQSNMRPPAPQGSPETPNSAITLLNPSPSIEGPQSRNNVNSPRITSDEQQLSEVSLLHSPQSIVSSLIASSPLVSSPLNDINVYRSDNISGQSMHSPIHSGSPITANSTPTINTIRSVVSSHANTTSNALQKAWTGIFDVMTSDFSSLTAGQQEFISSQMFEHPDRRMPRPCIWIPRDWKGVAQDQVLEMQTLFSDLRSSCSGANIDSNGDMMITQLPPDFDPLEVMKI